MRGPRAQSTSGAQARSVPPTSSTIRNNIAPIDPAEIEGDREQEEDEADDGEDEELHLGGNLTAAGPDCRRHPICAPGGRGLQDFKG